MAVTMSCRSCVARLLSRGRPLTGHSLFEVVFIKPFTTCLEIADISPTLRYARIELVLAVAQACDILAPVVCPAYGRHVSTVVAASFSVAVLRITWAVATYMLLAIVAALLLRVAAVGQGAVRRVPCCYLVRAGTIGLRQLGRQTMLRDGNVEHLRLIAITRCCQRQLRSPVNNQ